MSAVDDYLETVDPGRRPVLEHVRAVVRELRERGVTEELLSHFLR